MNNAKLISSASFEERAPVKEITFNDLFPTFENTLLDETLNDSIFGMPYSVRMARMPSFKKKKPVDGLKQSSEHHSRKKVSSYDADENPAL